ncbi:MAG: GTPase HflX [Desulfurococcales archaeon]|nr:GTPase HflX [Desulfurococcales archaeon]
MKKAILLVPRIYRGYIEEILSLATTAGLEIVHIMPLRSVSRIGRGKLEELVYLVEELKPDIIIFYGEPKPSEIYKITRETRVELWDRTLLILEIFRLHAGSREAIMQIEMARLQHLLPLIREWIRRKRIGELPGFMGPGIQDIEKYYRHVRRRIVKLRKELRKVRERRRTTREKRRYPHVAIVGYASAGKTSLFNLITGESKPVAEEFFTTLSPKHKAALIDSQKVIFIDTVGFIRDIPPDIVEAFNATLEETVNSDIIIFVLDASESKESIQEKFEAGINVLAKIGALHHPIIIALNKIDLLKKKNIEPSQITTLFKSAHKDWGLNIVGLIPISAKTGENIPLLLETIRKAIKQNKV